MYHDLTIQRLVATGDGLVTRVALLAAGLSTAAIGRRVRIGALIAVQPGVYRVPSVGLFAAAGATGGRTRSRSRRRYLAPIGGTGLELTERFAGLIELTVPAPRCPRLWGATVHRSSSLGASDIRWCNDLPVTSVDRTMVDLGAVCPQPIVAEAMEKAVIDRRTTIDHLYGTVDETARPGRRGVPALVTALDDWLLGEKPPDSALEPMMARVVRRHGLPAPVFQHEVRAGGRFVARVDFAWPAQMLVVEVDGLHAHATAAALQHDLRRQNELVALGYRVLRFPWVAVVREPDEVAARIAALLDRAVAA